VPVQRDRVRLIWRLAFSVLLITLPARAALAATIESLKIHLDIPSVTADEKLTTQHEIELIVDSPSIPSSLRLDLYAPDLTVTDVTTGQRLVATKLQTDWYTSIPVPAGRHTLKVAFKRPLFENAMPRFWWDDVDVELGWPFETTTPRVRNNLDVEVLAPLDMTTPTDFRCVRQGAKKLCSKSFGPSQIGRFKAEPQKGLRIGSVTNTWSTYALPGASAVLWIVLLLAVAAYRIIRHGAALPARGWMIGRSVIAVGVFAASITAYAFAVDGELRYPLPTATMYACAVFGVVALMFSHMHRRDRPGRSVLGWLAMLVAFPLGVVVAAASKDLMAPFVAAGMAGVAGLVLMYGESTE